MKLLPFKIGEKYKINKTQVHCVDIKILKLENLKGFSIIVFQENNNIYKMNRWPDGSLGRITKEKTKCHK
jgi:hypothetical protein